MAELKKKIRPGAIELHEVELALLVNYEVQEVLQQPDGSAQVTSSSQATKKITVKSLSARTDLAALAAEVVDKCKLIHPSKVGLVQQLLQQLQQRQEQTVPEAAAAEPVADAAAAELHASSGTSSREAQAAQPAAALATAPAEAVQAAAAAGTRPAAAAARPGSAASRGSAHGAPSARPGSAAARPASPHKGGGSSRLVQQLDWPGAAAGDEAVLVQQQQQQQWTLVSTCDLLNACGVGLPAPPPSFVEDLEAHMEGLYDEGLPARAAAAASLAGLCRTTHNLPVLLERANLLPTLARVLRDDGTRSLELAASLAGCFYACSVLAPLHRQLLDCQVGSLLMDLAALELQRSAALEAAEGHAASARSITARAAAAANGSGPPLEERERRLLALVVRQDRFLHLAVGTLAHLAEDGGVARKMRKKDIVGLLAGLLGRPHSELVLLATRFLRRLSAYAESKDRLASLPGVVPLLLGLLAPGAGEALAVSVLGLLTNLSFDTGLRGQMAAGGLVQLALGHMACPASAPLAAGLLYQLSLDEAPRALLLFVPGALQRLHDSLLRAMGARMPTGAGGDTGGGGFTGFAAVLSGAAAPGRPGLRSVPELVALAVNLAHSRRTAEWYCLDERLERLAAACLASADELGWKLLRNLATSGGQPVAARLLRHSSGMLALLQAPSTGPELFTEVLGCLAACCDALSSSSSTTDSDGSSSSSPLVQLLVVEDVLALLQACLAPGALEDDCLLEAVVLLGALAGAPEIDAALSASGLLGALVALMAAQRGDDEFVLQAAWAWRRGLATPATRAELLQHPQVIPYLVDLLQDGVQPVRATAAACLDALADTGGELADTIQRLKFEAHNQEWLHVAGQAAAVQQGAGWHLGAQPCALELGVAGPHNPERIAAMRRMAAGAMDGSAGTEHQQQWDKQQEHEPPDAAATQWLVADDGAGWGSVAAAGAASNDCGRPSHMLQAAGQRMVLDLDALLVGASGACGEDSAEQQLSSGAGGCAA